MAKENTPAPKVKAHIALGSNLDNPLQQLECAITHIKRHPNITVIAQAKIYRSTPQGPQDQDDFYNSAISIETTLSPLALLDALQSIEKIMGRIKTRHWGERIIDLDIIDYQQQAFNHARLSIPHPYAKLRLFVLLPLMDLDPNLHLDNKTVTEHLDLCSKKHYPIALNI